MRSFLAALPLCLLFCGVSSTPYARTSPLPDSASYDRHAVGERSYVVDSVKTSRRKAQRSTRAKRSASRHRHVSHSHKHHAATPVGAHGIIASTGARASVSTVARPHFTCLLNKLEAAGYRIDFMGGYASRGNSSAHPTGNALDINQTSRNVVTRRLPANATEIARECGLVHGAVWSNPDQGHFEMPRKYGYVFHHRRTRYATAR